jgi:acyl carrier protein
LPSGDIEFVGRIDHQVKLRGHRIELGEVETALRQHPAVRDAIVVVRETGGEKSLVAYLLGDQEGAANISDLRSFLRDRVPSYMAPASFVVLDEFPLTPSGKVDRRSLPEPDRSRPDRDSTYVAPRTPLEEGVAEIWAEVLGLDRVGVYDPFFELGGHSLLMTQILARLRDRYGVQLSVRTFFQEATVASLAIAVTQSLVERGDANKTNQLLEELEQLPIDEVEAFIERQMASCVDSALPDSDISR